VSASAASEPRWLTRGVAGISGASLLADLGHEVPTALLPSFLSSTLGAPATALGLIEGIADGCAGVARLAGGALADDPTRRRRTAVGGYTATAVLSSLIGVTTAAWQVGILRSGAWIARGLRVPARNALLADLVDPQAYGRAYGFERSMDNLGAIGGPLLALGLVAAVGTRNAMLVSVIPGLLAALAILYAIRATTQSTRQTHRPLRFNVRSVARGRLGRTFVGISAFEVGNVAATLLILRAAELLTPGHGHDSATEIALGLYIAYNAAATLSSFPGGRLVDRTGSIPVLSLGVGAFGIAYLGFALAGPSIAVLAIFFIAAGIAIGFVETAEHSTVAEQAPTALRGSAFGTLAAIQSLGNFAASAIAGILWTAVSAQAAFIYLAAWMLVALMTLTLGKGRADLPGRRA
jgi:MFS family permease